jgi:hypothetical protein
VSAGRKVEDGFIIASGDSSEVFEGVEEALPEVVFGIKRRGVVLCIPRFIEDPGRALRSGEFWIRLAA